MVLRTKEQAHPSHQFKGQREIVNGDMFAWAECLNCGCILADGFSEDDRCAPTSWMWPCKPPTLKDAVRKARGGDAPIHRKGFA